jgi:negative modulator of initiation of replication
MKTIVVDDELYAYLVGHTKEIGESASAILRRLLGLTQMAGAAAGAAGDLTARFDFLRDWDSLRHLTQTRKFLHLLSWAHTKHPQDFEKVLTIEGSRRKYFADDPQTLLQSGASTNPRPIPNTPYWVVTNSSTAKKAEILSDVFRLLGYGAEETQAMLARF